MFLPKKTLRLGDQLLDLSVPRVMGVLNITPDSFFDGGRYQTPDVACSQAEIMLQEGASIIDVGAASARPGATPITASEELQRILPVVRQLRRTFPQAILSVDTFRVEVAQQVLDEGVLMINDIAGESSDEAMGPLVARYAVPYVVMHMRGDSQSMMELTEYENLTLELIQYFMHRLEKLRRLGVSDVLIDPGFGFAKTPMQGFEILRNLDLLHIFEKPLLVGLSRKTIVWKTLGITPEHALNGSTVLHTLALCKGAHILRVHDVREAVEAVKLTSFGANVHSPSSFS